MCIRDRATPMGLMAMGATFDLKKASAKAKPAFAATFITVSYTHLHADDSKNLCICLDSINWLQGNEKRLSHFLVVLL